MSEHFRPRAPDGAADRPGDARPAAEDTGSSSDATVKHTPAASPPDGPRPPQTHLPTNGAREAETSGQGPAVSDWLAGDAPISYVAPVAVNRWQPDRPMASRFGDYELLDEIGRGGMGVTYRARQVSLNRIVALKMIKSGQLASQEEVLRFRLEAEAAAALDHPHIVPVFEVGQENGQHFFSMAYVEGCSLEDRLRDGPLPSQLAARLLVDVAEAIHYAHVNGIVHRDLKPANILLARDNRAHSTVVEDLQTLPDLRGAGKQLSASEPTVPKITDFGLAKRMEAGTDLTVTGQVLGTPSFMPPEQVDSRRGPVGPTADIYAIGAILYNTITGRPPFQAAGTHETLAQVLEREPVPPRQLNATVERDLETICLKCLEKDPSRRYASARELANELRRFLDDRPIMARPISSLARLGRWCKRRPALAASTAALLCTLIGGTLVSSYYAYQARKSAEFYQQEKLRANEETARAQAALASEREALGKLTRSLEETQQTIYAWVETTRNTALLREPRFKPVLKELLGQALTHYERFVRDHAGDQTSAMRQQLATAFFEIGLIQTESGSVPQAIEAYRHAMALYAQLTRENPQHPALLCGQGKSQTNLGLLLGETGQLDEATSVYESALATLEQLVSAHPQNDAFARDLAHCSEHFGLLLSDNNRSAEGLRASERAREIRSRLATQNSQDPDSAAALATSVHNLGRSCVAAGNTDDALSHFQDTKVQFARLAEQYPDRAEFRNGLARAHHSLGVVFWQTGEFDKAVTSLQSQQSILRQLMEQHPTVSSYHYDLAMSHDSLGAALAARGQLQDGLAACQEACQLLDQLVHENASVTRYAIDLAGAHFNLGNFHADAGSPDAALEAYRKALDIQQQLAADHPTVVSYRSDLANTLNGLGIVYSQTGRMAEAGDAYQQALSIEESLVRENPDMAALAIHLGGTYVNLASLRQHDAPETAVSDAGKAIDILAALRQREPDLVICQLYLRNAHWTRAVALDHLQRHRQAADDWQQALQLDGGPERWQCAARQTLSLALAGELRLAAAAALQGLRGLLTPADPAPPPNL